jgi:hypothetical protein
MPEAVRFSCLSRENTYLAGQISTDFMPSSNAFKKGIPLVSKSMFFATRKWLVRATPK